MNERQQKMEEAKRLARAVDDIMRPLDEARSVQFVAKRRGVPEGLLLCKELLACRWLSPDRLRRCRSRAVRR